jgi:uncharacterized membrane protein YbhN (UPF0104 family)
VSEAPSRLRTARTFLLRCLLAAGVLAYLFAGLDLRALWNVLRVVPISPLLIAFAATLGLHLLSGYRLRLLAESQGIDVSTTHAMRLNLGTLLYALFVPGGNIAAMAVRLYTLSRAGGRPAGGIVTLVYDRALGAAGLGLIGLIGIALDPQDAPPVALAVLGLGTASALAVAGPWLLPAPLRVVLRAWADRVSSGKPAGKVLASVRAARFLEPRRLIALLVLSVVGQAPGVVAFAVLAQALGVHASVPALGWVRSVVLLVTLIPVTFAGLGVREGAMLLLLRFSGAPEQSLLGLSLLVFAVTILAPGLVGVLWDGIDNVRSA